MLQRGLLFRRKQGGEVFLSLGFVQYVALGWKLHQLESGGDTFFSLVPPALDAGNAHENLEFLGVTGLSIAAATRHVEEFDGIPFVVCQELNLSI